MAEYLINHLRVPNGGPKPDGLVYPESVEATFKPSGGRLLALDPIAALKALPSGITATLQPAGHGRLT